MSKENSKVLPVDENTIEKKDNKNTIEKNTIKKNPIEKISIKISNIKEPQMSELPIEEMNDPVIKNAITKVNSLALEIKEKSQPLNSKKIKITHEMIELAYSKLKVIIKDKPTVENITILVAYAMQISNGLLDTSKTYKVELALAILRKLVDEEIDDIQTRVMLHMLIETAIPSLMNSISGLPGLFSRICKKLKCC